MKLLLGLDVGTTATKASLLTVGGDLVASASYKYGLITPHENWVEQKPEELWKGVVETCNQVMLEVSAQDRILTLSVSSQAGTTIPVDEDMNPLSNAISWMDHRAHQQSEEVRQTIGTEKIYQISGWPLCNGLPLLHIIWFRQNMPDLFSNTHRFLFVNDFIIHRLTGKLCMNPSDAGITQLFNIANGDWDADMLELAGIGTEQLSPMRDSGIPVGNITKKASRETDLPESVLVVNGAHDQYCAVLGIGVIQPGDVMLSCGTAWVVLGTMDHMVMDTNQRLCISRHSIPGKWGGLISMGGVGACMEWFVDKMWKTDGKIGRSEIYKKINEKASTVPVGSNGLVFLPLSGSYGSRERGAFIDLSLSHTQAEMARSIMEGIAFELKAMIGDIQKSGVPVNNLRMVGGAAQSNVWPEIVCNVTNLPVILPSVTEAASYGAAILAGLGYGAYSSPTEGYTKLSCGEETLAPSFEKVDQYIEAYKRYKIISQHMKEL